jgi:hypothetical protein
MPEKLFLSVGAMKAGTTWLYRQLEEHPQIRFTPEKELHYFGLAEPLQSAAQKLSEPNRIKKAATYFADKDADFISAHVAELRWYARFASAGPLDDAWYQDLFADVPPQAYAADFSNLYTLLGAQGWAAVRRNCSTLRVIYTLRDPIERIWSHYRFEFKYRGNERLRESNFDWFKNLMSRKTFWVHAQYLAAIQRMRAELGPQEFLLLYFEDFRTQPESMLHRVCDFLGIERIQPEADRLTRKFNASPEMEMPEEWAEWTRTRLAQQVQRLKANGYWHPAWKT